MQEAIEPIEIDVVSPDVELFCLPAVLCPECSTCLVYEMDMHGSPVIVGGRLVYRCPNFYCAHFRRGQGFSVAVPGCTAALTPP